MKILSDIVRPRNSEEKNDFLFRLVSILCMLGGLVYLGFKLVDYNQDATRESFFANLSDWNYFWLLLVFILLPINLFLESLKWKRTIRHLEDIPIFRSLAAVLSGMSTGFITPNKLGDIVGRLLWLKPENKNKGIGFLAVNSLTQNLAIMLIGIPSALLFFLNHQKETLQGSLLIWFAGIFIVLILIYYRLPSFIKKSKIKPIIRYAEGIRNLTSPDLHEILGWSLIRFLVLVVQLYALLQFMDTSLSPMEAAITLPAYFLFITFTPSIAWSDAIIRSTYAVLFLSRFNNDPAVISVAGIALWVVNIVLPVMAGSVLTINKNLQKKK